MRTSPLSLPALAFLVSVQVWFKSRLHLGVAGVDARRATPPDARLPAGALDLWRRRGDLRPRYLLADTILAAEVPDTGARPHFRWARSRCGPPLRVPWIKGSGRRRASGAKQSALLFVFAQNEMIARLGPALELSVRFRGPGRPARC